ncbi:hypothetical protein HaLaN_02048 [Haematococcus lacustris]|uniref:Uncharacterized protein n=1 Tax=Haematococcus lacustris TaxID=44745 RepID=A0A699YAQ8_HAELA|nr:hypothetical protein HaLaN_02048 [Haematococcus lacustris]
MQAKIAAAEAKKPGGD